MFFDALRAMLVRNLYCRKCKAVNVRHAKPTIEPDATGSRALCNNCSAEGPIEQFQPPKENGHA